MKDFLLLVHRLRRANHRFWEIIRSLGKANRRFWDAILGEPWNIKTIKVGSVILPCIFAYILCENEGYWTAVALFGGSLLYNVSQANQS
jgi:hypothetical protein